MLRLSWGAMLALGACGGLPPPGMADSGAVSDGGVEADGAAPTDAATVDAEAVEVPYLASDYRRVFAPAGGRYVNDHALVRAGDGRWHLIGITHDSPGNPQAERSFLHATAPSLTGPWTELPDALMTTMPEQVLWAPHIFEREPGRWTMLYWGSTPDNQVQRADSDDLLRWTRVMSPVPGGRDPHVARVGDRWVVFSVGVRDSHGQIIATTSDDLARWSPLTVVTEDPIPSFGWGNLESPFLVRRGAWFYLFVTRTSAAPADYDRTVVLRSADPLSFRWEPVTEIVGHACEVVEEDGRAYLTSAGWTSQIGEDARGLSVARLEWAAPPR